MRLSIGLVLVVLVAGCVAPTPAEPPQGQDETVGHPCEPFYFVGCDDNPDAKYMLETYGLNQFTNSTVRVARPEIDYGVTTWIEGGHGDPSYRLMMRLDSLQRYEIPKMTEAIVSSTYPFPDGGVIFSEIPLDNGPEDVEWSNASIYHWHPGQGKTKLSTPESFPYRPYGISGDWILLWGYREEPDNMGGLGAIQIAGSGFHELYPYGMPSDGSFFGTPLIDSAIGGGYAFLSMLWAFEPGKPNAIVQVDLETGERKEILNVTGHSIQAMDASEDYLVLQANIDGESGIWAWDIQAQQWFFVQEGRDRAATHPKVGGHWIVYLEHRTENHPSILVGYHVRSKTYNELVVREPLSPRSPSPFGILRWDTDGDHVVAHIQIDDDSSMSPFEFWGSQLYWMELPDIETVR